MSLVGDHDGSMRWWLDHTSPASAAVIAPLLVQELRPSSVLDVGCGSGAWLAAFQRAGVQDVLGLDGAEVDRASLVIDPERFRPVDLLRPPSLGRTFDLVCCLEVAEHLPRAAAPTLVEFLTVSAAGPVLFSAAVPGQGGAGHVNEQWPEFWANLFRAHGWVALDALRSRLWNDGRVAWWYRQNAFLFVRREHADRYSHLCTGPGLPSRVVHPELLAMARERVPLDQHSPRELLWALRRSLGARIAERYPAVAPLRGLLGGIARSLRMRPRPSRPKLAWVRAEDPPASPRPLERFRLFGIIGAWMEEDVIAATVTNAFTQGCERVYLVDNDSRDGTVREALAAGALLGEVFATEQYDEQLRLDIMNRVVTRVSREEGDEHIWWLWLDADEFPHGPRGQTVRQFLEPLDRRFRVVGARFINHFPDTEPEYVSGYHPLDFQPLCEEHRMGCALQHRKHPLQRFDRSGPPIICDRGFHRATSLEQPLLEPSEAIFLHHFPYRARAVTRRRLALLCGTDEAGRTRVREGDDAVEGMVPRFQTLEAVYRGDWEQVRNYSGEGAHALARPVAWSQIAGSEHASFARWYDLRAVEAAKRSASEPR